MIFHPAVVASRGIDDDFNRNAAVALLRCDRGFHQQSGESDDLIGADASVVVADANPRRTTDEARHQRAQGESLGLRPVINVAGTVTVLGASIMVPEAVAAMAATSTIPSATPASSGGRTKRSDC